MSVKVGLSGKRGAAAFIVIDVDDLPIAQGRRWYLAANGYAYTQIAGKTTYLHRLILNPRPGLLTDHINGDRLDNRRANLREVTPSQNGQNARGARSDSGTGARGVYPYRGRYEARLFLNGKGMYLGSFPTLDEADAAAQRGRAAHFTHSRERREVR